MAKEEIIFEYQVDMGNALADAERFKRNIIQTKEEQKALNDAYKKGSISLEEYAADSVRLEAILKKETTTYNNLSKSMTGTKTQTDKLIESNAKLAKSNENLGSKFQSVAGNINIAGTNLGSLSSGMTAFLNPATAAASIVGTLATAYFSTGRGAQDLEQIQFKLSATTEILSNKLADVVDYFKDSDSAAGGFFRSIVSGLPGVQAFSNLWRLTIGGAVDELAVIKDKLDDLNQATTKARTEQNNLLEDNSGLLEEINQEQTTFNDKIFKAGQMIDNIRSGETAVVSIKEQELQLLNDQLLINKDSEVLQRSIADKELEISQEKRKAEKLVNNILKLQDNLNTAEDARIVKLQQQLGIQQQIAEHKASELGTDEFSDPIKIEESTKALTEKNDQDIRSTTILAGMTLETDKLSKSVLKKADSDVKAANASARAAAADRDRTGSLLILSNAIGGASTIFEKHTIASRALSAVQAGINSYLAGTEVLKDPTFIGRPVQRIVAMVATIAAGLAQQGKILGAFAGGGSFTTKGPSWILVGDNPGGKERVDVTPISGKGKTRIFNDGAAMAGGGSINGSILAASNTAPIDAQLGLESVLSEPVNVNFVESDYRRFSSKIAFKESMTSV